MELPQIKEKPAYNYCALPLANYASRPDISLGRIHEEEESKGRTCFQRDRDRIIHASAFRRLKYKTQVFVYHEGDHYRTRLTHSLEVAQIARTLARSLFVNEDLAEGVALAHDLGHTPFAHLGEYALQDCMKPYGGFDHNDQSLRILTHLEHKYPKWIGLNLTWETLEGVAKHNGPIIEKDADAMGADWKRLHLSETLYDIQKKIDLRLNTYASLEAQVAALSDDIAYNNHDVEDGLRAGMFTLKDIEDVPLLGRQLKKIRSEFGDLPDDLMGAELVREMIGEMVSDVYDETCMRIHDMNIDTPEDVRLANSACVDFSPEMKKEVDALREFLFANMYRHHTLNRISYKVDQIIKGLFEAFMSKPETLPDPWQEKISDAGGDSDKYVRARIVKDYIAGMTDRFAIREHSQLYDLKWDVK